LGNYFEKNPVLTTAGHTFVVALYQTPTMWSSWAESAKSSVTNALEKTGDVLSKAATNAAKASRVASSNDNASPAIVNDTPAAPAPGRYSEPTIATLPPQRNELLSTLSQGWSNVVETTRASIKQAEVKVKEQQVLLQEQLNKVRASTYKRDPMLPLDVDALKDAEVVYITDRLITMGHPASKLDALLLCPSSFYCSLQISLPLVS
jgi:hypothetical protein